MRVSDTWSMYVGLLISMFLYNSASGLCQCWLGIANSRQPLPDKKVPREERHEAARPV